MKRVQVTENQYNGFLKKLKRKITSQDISNIRHNVSDLKKNELKVIARDAITKAFLLGCEYEKTSELDMAQRKEILRKLNGLQAKIDIVN